MDTIKLVGTLQPMKHWPRVTSDRDVTFGAELMQVDALRPEVRDIVIEYSERSAIRMTKPSEGLTTQVIRRVRHEAR